jgi:hypothetical protein
VIYRRSENCSEHYLIIPTTGGLPTTAHFSQNLSMQHDTQDPDPFHHFFMECHKIGIEAQFLVDALPNADQAAVERAVHQLDAIRTILSNLDDPQSSAEQLAELITYVTNLLLPLESHLHHPPPPPASNLPRNYTNRRGRPGYVLDLDRANLLHDLGNTWSDVANAMQVSRRTLYNHMATTGRSTARREWSDITDDELDELVSEISLSHPFIGSTILLGHLEAQGLHLPPKRVQESLRRVDRIGTLVR